MQDLHLNNIVSNAKSLRYRAEKVVLSLCLSELFVPLRSKKITILTLIRQAAKKAAARCQKLAERYGRF